MLKLAELISQLRAEDADVISSNERYMHLVNIFLEAARGKKFYVMKKKQDEPLPDEDRMFFEDRGFNVKDVPEHVDMGGLNEANWQWKHTTYITW